MRTKKSITTVFTRLTQSSRGLTSACFFRFLRREPCRQQQITRCILPDILAYYESEEDQREFREWLAQREAEASEKRQGKASK